MKKKEFKTIREYIYWCYANMAMAHVALQNFHKKYEMVDYMIRAKLYKGLCTGSMKISTFYDDEKYKLNTKQCCYCGRTDNLTLDHLIPKFSEGQDTGDNFLYACKSCNSSKNKNDLLVWFQKRNEFPPILVLRRYLKLAVEYFGENDILDLPIENLNKCTDSFRIDLLPYEFLQPISLKL